MLISYQVSTIMKRLIAIESGQGPMTLHTFFFAYLWRHFQLIKLVNWWKNPLYQRGWRCPPSILGSSSSILYCWMITNHFVLFSVEMIQKWRSWRWRQGRGGGGGEGTIWQPLTHIRPLSPLCHFWYKKNFQLITDWSFSADPPPPPDERTIWMTPKGNRMSY